MHEDIKNYFLFFSAQLCTPNRVFDNWGEQRLKSRDIFPSRWCPDCVGLQHSWAYLLFICSPPHYRSSHSAPFMLIRSSLNTSR